MSDPAPSPQPLTPDLLRAFSSLSGVELSADRAESLVAQAEQQFGLMRVLDSIPAGESEPAGALRLDRNGDME